MLGGLGSHKIENFRFFLRENGNIKQIPIDDIFLVFEVSSPYRWFMPIKPNIYSNIDLKATPCKSCLNFPFGLPIYANSLDTIKAIDLTYDSFVNEIQNYRKRFFVTQEPMKIGGDGCFKNSFDPEDVVFYILEGDFDDKKGKYVQEVNGELRVTDLRETLQTHLDLLAVKLWALAETILNSSKNWCQKRRQM